MTGNQLEEVRKALRIPRPLFAKALGYQPNKLKKLERKYADSIIEDIDFVSRILAVVPQMILNHVQALNVELKNIQAFGASIEALGTVVEANIKNEKWKERFDTEDDDGWKDDDEDGDECATEEDTGTADQAEG